MIISLNVSIHYLVCNEQNLITHRMGNQMFLNLIMFSIHLKKYPLRIIFNAIETRMKISSWKIQF